MSVYGVLVLLVLGSQAATGSNAQPKTAAGTQLTPDNVDDSVPDERDAHDFVDPTLPHCKFNKRNSDGSCLSPTEITIAPPRKQLPPAEQPFPGKNSLIVVSSNSTMEGDIKCTGVDDHIQIQMAIDNMNTTGGTVILSEGIFNLNAPILMCNKLRFIGQGMNRTILFVSNYSPEYPRAGTVRGYAVKDVIMRDMQVDGNRLYNPGDAYIKGPAYGKFGLFCESCIDVLYLRVGTLKLNNKAQKVIPDTDSILTVQVKR
jgi:hypothetical protein